MEQKIYPEITKLAGTTIKDGTYYELQELIQYSDDEEVIPHYNGEDAWYRVAITSPTGMILRYKEFGPDENKAYRYLKSRK